MCVQNALCVSHLAGHIVLVCVDSVTHLKLRVVVRNHFKCSLDVLDSGDRGQCKEPSNVGGQTLIKSEPCKPHHCPLGVTHIEDLVLTCYLHHISQHGWEVNLSMLIKAGEKIIELINAIHSMEQGL